MLRIYNMQNAGYPFDRNDLTVEEWLDLGVIKQMLNPAICPFMGRKATDGG